MAIVLSPPDFGKVFGNAEKLNALLTKAMTPEFQKIVCLANDRYYHWDKFRYQPLPEGLSHEDVWAFIRIGRKAYSKTAPFQDKNGESFAYGIPDFIYKELHEIDLWSGGNITTDQPGQPPPKEQYIISSLMEEAIASSQLEGAATTRRVAKDMLRTGRKAENKNEQMILNNWETMQYIRESQNQQLTPERLYEIHSFITKETLENPEEAGQLRKRDDIIVEYKGETVHVPPKAESLAKRMEAFCHFANKDESENWIHPVIKGVMLHFWLAYDHPFTDGNGRTARALMYWYLLSRKYVFFEYLSISKYMLKAPGKYVRAYLYTETDDNDLTYFFMYNLHAIRQAIEDLKVYLKRKQREMQESTKLLQHYRGLNVRQKNLVYHAIGHPDSVYTIQMHRNHHGIAYDTARNDLLALVKKKLLKKDKQGYEYIFLPAKKLVENLRSD